MMVAEILGTVLALGGGAYALAARHLMRGVLGLTAVFLGVAVLFYGLGATYLAAGQLLLYVGGVVTLFVLAFNAARTPLQRARSVWGSLLALLAAATLALVLPTTASPAAVPLRDLASTFFAGYGWALVVAIALLCASVIVAQYALEDES